MASEIKMGYVSGKTLTYGAYQPDGTVRTAAGTALPEIGATGYYVASDANLAAGDVVIVKEGTVVRGAGEYKPEVSASEISADLTAIEGKIDTVDTVVDGIDANVDLVLIAQQQVRSNLGGEEIQEIRVIKNL